MPTQTDLWSPWYVTDEGNPVTNNSQGTARSAGWMRSDHQDVVTHEVLEMREVELQAEVLKLRRHLRVVGTIIRLLLVPVRVSGCSLENMSSFRGQAHRVFPCVLVSPCSSLFVPVSVLHANEKPGSLPTTGFLRA